MKINKENFKKYLEDTLVEMYFLSNGKIIDYAIIGEDAIDLYQHAEVLNLTHIRVKGCTYPISMGPYLIEINYPININPMLFYEYFDEDVCMDVSKRG